jgi:hypothetical protein
MFHETSALLSLKNTSLERATSLNEKNVQHQKKYKELLVKCKFPDNQICSLDEIGVMIVIQTYCSSIPVALCAKKTTILPFTNSFEG